MRISEFIKKRQCENLAAIEDAEKRLTQKMNGAYKNIAMLFTNSEVWKDVRFFPGVLMVELKEDAIELFRDSMKILGKDIISLKGGNIFQSNAYKDAFAIECNYSLGNDYASIDGIFDTIINELCDLASSDRSEIEQIGKSFNEISPII